MMTLRFFLKKTRAGDFGRVSDTMEAAQLLFVDCRSSGRRHAGANLDPAQVLVTLAARAGSSVPADTPGAAAYRSQGAAPRKEKTKETAGLGSRLQ